MSFSVRGFSPHPLRESTHTHYMTLRTTPHTYLSPVSVPLCSFSYPQEAVDPEAVDPEMQEEFEAFIEEIEEHLMMQEFGPDPEAEEADSAQ